MDPNADVKRLLTLEDVRRDVAEALECAPSLVGDADDLLRLGLDSIAVMRLSSRWRSRGAEVTFAELIEWRTLAEWWELLSSRLDEPAATVDSPLPEIDESAPFGLATMQYAYWIGRADGQPLGGVGAHFYNEFDGHDVDPLRLETAIRVVLSRHPMLRAIFGDDGTQRILSYSPWPGLTVHDLRAETDAEVDKRMLALRDELSHRRLRVERAETFDIQLSLLPGGATRMHVHIEMLVADAHSFRIILSDLARLYEHPEQEQELEPITLTFPRYLAAVAAAPDEARERARDYWQQRLDTLPGPPELPLATDPSKVDRHRVTRHHHWLTPADQALLARRAREHDVTLSVVFLTAFAEVLASWSASNRFLLNLPMYDRRPVHPEVPALVGDFTNLLLVEMDVSEPASFAARAQAHQERLRADAARAAYSGVDVLRDLSRRRGGQPVGAPVVFTSALSLGELFDADVRSCFGTPGWTMSQTPQVWLDYQITEREDGLFLNWDVVDELFPPGLTEDMFGAYLRLVDWLLAPDSDWSQAGPELLAASTRAVRAAANATASPTRQRMLHDDFFARAAETPDAPAVLWAQTDSWSYGELAGRAQALADELTDRGLQPGQPVAITLPKGPEQVLAVLGVLHAGGVYVPVGVDQPAQRRDRILDIAQARFAVANPGVEMDASIEVVTLPALPVRPRPSTVPAAPESPAYLLFTSGSTGLPKGVRVPHRAAVNTIDDLNERFSLGARDRILAVSALDFDLSVFDIFGPLSAGGAVVVITEDSRRDAARWVQQVREREVTIWQSVPALLDMLLTEAEADGGRLPLRLSLLGGDWVGLNLSARLADRSPGARLIALGGTTETAIHSTVQEVPVPVPEHWRSVPYGVPLHNQLMRVADPLGRDRPDWVPGELWIGGRSVALGYHGDPVRTAAQFVQHDGQYWYRTGDLARYWPDGTVEFLGRADFQVKIRGHRIELGEIESALESDPRVARAVVVPVGEGERRHLAAVVAPTGAPPAAEELRALLTDRVPAYMVPAVILVREALPLSANGKIDRKQVTQLVAADVDSQAIDPPQGEVERAVAQVWSELLGVESIGRDHNFFSLGGDSLVATRLLARLREAGLVGADLRRLFSTPVLKDFAAGLSRGEAGRAAPALTADPEHRHDPFPPTDVQRAYWIGRTDDFALGGVGSHWYWEFDGGDVDLAKLESAVNHLIERHDMLRAIFDDDGNQRVLAQVPRFTITVREGADELVVLRDELSKRVPDPATWPLINIRAVRYGDNQVRLGFSFDYIVLDALSIVIFFAELSTLYADPTAVLPPLGVSFRDYLLSVEPDAQDLQEAAAYWLARLDTLAPAPQLPLAVDPATVFSPTFHRRERFLTPAQWQAITAQARRHQLTPAAVLATAYAEVLSAFSGRDELTLNLTMFQRSDVHPDIGKILGDFTSLLLVGHRAEPGDGWLDVARRLQHDMWDGMAHGAVSALWVLREMARRTQSGTVNMPVVFTSALGVAGELVNLQFPFGGLIWGISQTPQVWLDNQVMERDGGLVFNWDSVDELFPAGMLDEMFSAYHRLLSWLADSDWATAAPELLPPAQREIRAAVNATEGRLPRQCLHADFFARAAAEPDRPALLFGEQSRTYGQLAEQALRIAAELLAQGVAPGDPVAVTLARGPDQIAAVLGVLAAGAAYVPVGVDQPSARRDRIYAKAGITVAVSEPTQIDGVTLVAPDPAGPGLAEPVQISPDTLAYTIFTSGSTGEPKGVEITHVAAVNTITDINQRYGVSAQDRVLTVSSLDFDLSVYDIFGLLSAGGALVLIGAEDRREARRWAELVHRHHVTIWNSVPALLDMLLVASAEQPPVGLRVVLVSGDWVGLDLPGRLAAAAPHARFVALGGATEAAIWSNACEVIDVPAHWRSIPYGRPLRNQRYRVTDPRGRDCPDWVPGELRIGGAGVALGYRNAPEITAAQFVTDAAGQRWYRTGDLGRYWPDGTLEFLGRVDFQVKLRGHRIELGEIEAAAQAHPGVAGAVALVIGEGSARHIALAAVAGGDGLDERALATLLAERLPGYMVPERIAVLEQLPLTGNGKVDRRVVQQLVAAGAATHEDEPPQGDTEKLLAGLWSELLDDQTIGRHRSFFALGGDSLLATRLLEMLRQRYGLVLTLRQLFAAPTVAQLGAVVDLQVGAPDSADFEEGVI